MNKMQRTVKYPPGLDSAIIDLLSSLRADVHDELSALSSGGITPIVAGNYQISGAYKETVRITGTITGNEEFVVSNEVRKYLIINDWSCSSDKYVYIRTQNGNGVYMAPGDVWSVYCDGTNIKPIRLLNSVNVTGPSTSVVDEIATFNNTTGTLLKSSGKKIGNAYGNVPLNNGLENVGLIAEYSMWLKRLPDIVTGNVMNLTWSYGAGTAFFCNNFAGNVTGLPTGAPTWANIEVYGRTGDTLKVILRDSLSLAIWMVHVTAAGNGGWVKIREADGSAVTISGAGMTPHDVTSSRAFATTYSNNTGKLMMVYITISNGGSGGVGADAYVGGVSVLSLLDQVPGAGERLSFMLVVPAGSTYMFRVASGSPTIFNVNECY